MQIALNGTLEELLALARLVCPCAGTIPETVNFLYQGKEIEMLGLTDTEQGALTLVFKDTHGHPTTPPAGQIIWSTSDAAIATSANVAADGMSATAVGHGPGTCQITAGTGTVFSTLDVTVTASAAVSSEIIPGAITQQPTA